MAGIDKWQNRWALVTGASSGIGEQFARILAQHGCHLLLTARRRDRLEALAAELRSRHGVQVVILVQDLSMPEGALALWDQVQREGHPVDLLIHNAGYGVNGPFAGSDLEREQAMIRLNMASIVDLTKRMLPSMLARRQGDILLVGSVGAYVPAPGFAVYSATKAFVKHFGEVLNHELRQTGVGVTVLNPGGTVTEFSDVAGMQPTKHRDLGMMSAQRVALIGLKAMARGRRTVTPGLLNKVMVAIAVHGMPGALRLRSAAWFLKLAGGRS